MIARRTVLLMPLFAAACGGDDGSTAIFSQPSYSYLTRLRLNVASIEIDDRTPPVPTNALETLAPLRPSDALKQMARDRLFAGGSAGRGVFVIDAAQLVRVNGSLEGRLAVHLDIYTGGETRVGFAEAQVARRRAGADGSENPRAALYSFVSQMMDDMNVEFEFQVRRSLKDYLQDTEGTAPPPPPVQSQDLSAPGPAPALAPRPPIAPAPPPAHVLVHP
jgi:hypothetical protein